MEQMDTALKALNGAWEADLVGRKGRTITEGTTYQNTWASGHRDCGRAMALDLTHPHERDPFTLDQMERMAEGDEMELAVTARLIQVGQRCIPPFQVTDLQKAFQIKGRSGRTIISGKIDGRLTFRGLGSLVFDVKRWLNNRATTSAELMEGVSVVRDGDFIALLHKSPDQASEALSRINSEFDVPQAKVDDKTIFDYLQANAGRENIVAQGGDLRKGQEQAGIVIEQRYLDGYKAHAAIETHTALAKVEGDRATVWISTQTPFPTRDQIANALGFRPDNVRVITPFVGGGFGGKSSGQQAVEAARLAKATGKPVQVAWTREEEFFYDTFRPAAVVKIKSGITKEGRAVLWDYIVYYAGERGAAQFYDIAHHRTVSIGGGFGGGPSPHPFATGAWRAPANNTNTFARESQIDIMAAKAKMDPIEFRLKNARDERLIRVLKAAAERFGWKSAVGPSGRGLGVACGTDSGTYVAQIAEVEVDKRTGRVKVKRIACAQDMGLVINSEGATIQMEGCITMGLGYTLTEDIHFSGGMILDRNFDTYELPRFSSLPKIETFILDLKNEPAQGGGEPAIITVGAVVANAIHDATGARLLQLPMNPERVRKAVAAIAALI